jgi:predicted DsbA family dithiol-disulfide isomerase
VTDESGAMEVLHDVDLTGSTPASVIEVFADVRCPFTHVGLRRLVERRTALERSDLVLRVRAWPLELVNGAPLDPCMIAEEVEELRAQVARDLFECFDPSRFPDSSLPALMLAAVAYEHSSAMGERVSLALRDALFEEGRDIGAPDVLLDIASAAGVELPADGGREQVLGDWREGKRRGVIGSPHFFVGDEGFFCPSLDIARVDGHLSITFDPAGFDAFLARCLES